MPCTVQLVPFPQVTRFPITGPGSFNTLVCCAYGAWLEVSFPKLEHFSAKVPSPFVLSRFSQNDPPPVYDHTTIGTIAQIGPGKGDSAFLYGIDQITTVGYDETGRFFVELNLALMNPALPDNLEGIQYSLILSVCSYIRVQEPTPAPSLHGPGIHLLNPPGFFKGILPAPAFHHNLFGVPLKAPANS